MAVDQVEIVDNIDKGYWRRNDSSSEDPSESESEVGSVPQTGFNHLDKR